MQRFHRLSGGKALIIATEFGEIDLHGPSSQMGRLPSQSAVDPLRPNAGPLGAENMVNAGAG